MKKHSCLHFCSLPDNSYSCGIKGERERERERVYVWERLRVQVEEREKERINERERENERGSNQHLCCEKSFKLIVKLKSKTK